MGKLRIASFFSGIGGFDLAFQRAGAEVVYQCEIDPFCQKVLTKHWPQVPKSTNILDIEASQIPNAEIWCAGFPCQDLSLANQGKRRGLAGERSGLFNRIADLADSRKPDWLVLENVPGLLNSGNGADFKHVIQTLDDLGYFVAWRVLDSKFFGTPQRRRRVFIVASREIGSASRVLFEQYPPQQVAPTGNGQGASASERFGTGLQSANLFAIQHATIGRKASAGPQAKGYRNDGETYTLDSRGSADVVCAPTDGFRVRDTPGVSRELDSRRLRALGNAVNVNVVSWIAERLVEESKRIESTGEKQCLLASQNI